MTNIFDQMSEKKVPLPEVTADAPSDFPEGQHHHQQAMGTPVELKLVIQELLKHGSIEESARHELFRRALVHGEAIAAALEPLDLTIRFDTHRGVAFLATADPRTLSSDEPHEDSWSHPLVRKQRLTLEQSLLAALLRHAFAMHEQEYGVGQAVAKTSLDELLPNFLTYFGDSGSDAKNENRLLQLLEQLKTHGIVSEVDSKQEIMIRPLIAHLASPDSLSALLEVLKEKMQTASPAEDD